MSAARENVLVVDVSVLPVRPDIGKVKAFLETEIHLDYALVKSIQLHHTRNCILIEMVDKKVASRYQLEHNCKRTIFASNKAYKIPVYVDGDAVTVRVNDLPSTVSNEAITESMLQFGEVISIRSETWKHYFPGIPNGVRVLRMNLFRDIPSNISIANENTTISYPHQPSRRYSPAAHPNKNYTEPRGVTDAAPTTVATTELFTRDDFPPLSGEQSSSSKPTAAEQKTHNDDEWTDVEDNGSSSSDYNEVTNKRRRSNRKANEAKKVCANQCSLNADHGETVDFCLKEKSALKNKSGKGASFTSCSKK